MNPEEKAQNAIHARAQNPNPHDAKPTETSKVTRREFISMAGAITDGVALGIPNVNRSNELPLEATVQVQQARARCWPMESGSTVAFHSPSLMTTIKSPPSKE